MNLPTVSFAPIEPALFPPNVAELHRTAKRLTQLLSKGSSNLASQAQKEWSLDFLLSPKSFEASKEAPHNLSSISFQKQILQAPNLYDSNAKAVPAGESVSLGASLAFRSIGYESEAIGGMRDLGIDFDTVRGIIPNDSQGRILNVSAPQSSIPGLYCSGWVKRGPAGVIANTMEDAFGTAHAIFKDWKSKQPFMAGEGGWEALQEEARAKGLRPVTWTDWQKIDAAERARGKPNEKEREKFASTQEMLGVLD